MKVLFNEGENTAKVLSNAAMKQVLGGWEEEKSPEEGGCRIRCVGWPADQYMGISNCGEATISYCGHGVRYEECICG